MNTLTRTQTNTMQGVSATKGNAPAAGNGQTVGSFVQNRADQTLGARTQAANVETKGHGVAGGVYGDAKAAPLATDKKDIKAKQAEFVADMKAAGIKGVHNPPTEAELKKYFGTFNSKDKREAALEQFENYTNAFHTHTAEVKGQENKDITYSSEKNYIYNGQRYDSEKEARKAAVANGEPKVGINWVDTKDASKWSDVDGKKAYNGRKIQDCEGFAYMSRSLLGAAGYEVSHSVNKDTNGGNGHEMTVLKDPDSGKLAVTSNSKTFTGGTQQQLLTKGYDYATGGQATAGKFYVADTAAHAATDEYLATH